MAAKTATRTDAVTDLWTRPAPSVSFGREVFRYRVIRTARKLPTVDMDPWVQGCDWERSGGIRTGEMNFSRPLAPHMASMIAAGDEVRCDVAVWGAAGPWKTLWQLKVTTPSDQIKAGIVSLALSSTLDPLTRSKVAWRFVKGKNHPRGWTAREITLNVAARFRVKVGALPKSTWPSTKLIEKSLSPYDMVVRAWTLERQHTGRRFDIDMSTGVLNVTEVREPKYMLLLGAAAAEAVVTESITGVASALVATATHKVKGHKAKKLKVKVVDQGRRARYGYIVKTVQAPAGIDSTAALRKWATARLARMYRAKRTVTFTHPGIPLVDRGDAVRLFLPEVDFHQIVFVTSAHHQVSAGSYTMDITIGFDDPWSADVRAARVQQKKDAAAAARARKAAAKAKAAKPAKAKTRSDG